MTTTAPTAPARDGRSGRGVVLGTVALLFLAVVWMADAYSAGKLEQWSNDLAGLVGTLSLEEIETPLAFSQGGVAGELGLPGGGRVRYVDDQVIISIQRSLMWHTRCVTGRGPAGGTVEQVEVTEGSC